MDKRQRKNRGTIYKPKICEMCGDEYTPTSGRQRVCTRFECQAALVATFRSRQTDRYAEKHPRITEKECENEGCSIVFSVAYTGVIPPFCPECKRESIKPRQREATKKWSLQTIDAPCLYWNCTNLQHPSGRGWCFYHYPILDVHGLNADDWWAMFEGQNGLCPICTKPLLEIGTIIVIDHDHVLAPNPRHDKEHARGLLHSAPCNTVIVGGIETAIANGWLTNALKHIGFSPEFFS